MVNQDEKDGETRSNRGPERIYIKPELHEATRRGDIKLFDELLRAHDRAPNDRHECQIAINVTDHFPREISKTSCFLRVTYSGDTLLHIAAHSGQIEVAKRICKESRSLLTRGNTKLETPLHYAAQAGNLEMVDLFTRMAHEEGDDIILSELLQKTTVDGETALHYAVRHKHQEVVQKLMQEDPHHLACICDDKNISPLYLAVMLRSLPMVTCLVDHLSQDLPQEAYAGPGGQNALHAAAVREIDFSEQVLRKKPQLMQERDETGRTPLYYATSANNLKVVEMLLAKDKTSAYIADTTSHLFPVHVAAKLGILRVLKKLFEQCPGSDELLDDEGRNFLHLAVKEKRSHVVQWVCKNSELEKAMNTPDIHGNTPLHLAVKAREPNSVFNMILSKRVDLNWVNKDEFTPLDIAYLQRKDTFSDLQNPDYVIFSVLHYIGCSFGTRIPTDQLEVQNDSLEHEEKEKKQMESYESMAKSMSIGSVLIASAAFTAAFTVYGVYINKKDIYGTPQMSLAFKVFVLMDAYAFLCSIIATAWLVEASLPFLDPSSRKGYLLKCTALVMMAARGFIIAFATGAYVILIPVSKWLAILVSLSTGVVGPAVLQLHHWPKMSVLKIVTSYKGSKKKLSMIFLEWYRFYLGTFVYAIIMLVLLRESLSHWSPKRSCSPRYLFLDWSHPFVVHCPELTLAFVIIILVFSSYIPLITILADRFQKKDALKYHISKYT